MAYVPTGADFRISNAVDLGADRDSDNSAVAYNSTANEYLVVWRDDQLANGQDEIYGQRVSVTGTETGSDFRISNASDIGTDRDAENPAVAYNPTTNQFLVTWEEDGVANGENEIYGQRLSAAGAELGTDIKISDATGLGSTRDALHSSVAYNSTGNSYLVVYEADELLEPFGPGTGDDIFEIFGHAVSATGVAGIGEEISFAHNASGGSSSRDATRPSVAHNSTANGSWSPGRPTS